MGTLPPCLCYPFRKNSGCVMPSSKRPVKKNAWLNAAMGHLEAVVGDLSKAEDLDDIMHVVRTAARNLMGADGATFVLRDNEFCYYADEDAIAPLWKGQRFPMAICISGWAMLNDTPAIIEDIYADERIPHDAYRPTFVKSLVMMPVSGVDKPVAAIGTYWARPYKPNADALTVLEKLAEITSAAMENIEQRDTLPEKLRAALKSE